VASAYRLPFLGLDGAGEGGRSWPSRSTWAKALARTFALLAGTLPLPSAFGGGVDSDMAGREGMVMIDDEVLGRASRYSGE
jgi:hypothetical protein